MADNIRDVYSVVFESLGEQKLVQDLNKINAALLQQKKLFEEIGKLPGLDKTVDKSAKALKSALNTINARLQAEKKAQLERLEMIDTEEKIERKEEAIKNRKLAFVQKVISQELALYRQLEVEKAKIMAKYGQLPASLQTLKAPMSPLYTDKGATNIRQENIPNYRQAMQDAKLFVVEQNKLKQQEAQRLATQRQQTAEANRQLSTARQQTKEMTKQNSLLISFKKGIQKFGTDSFVFQRMFDSITRTLDEWSKMSIAMSQFRASANFENMNRQLDETVVRLGNVISKYEMIPAINKAKMLGMDFSGNKLSETLEMTTKVSQMFGMDATKAFGDFTVAISKASPIIMDNVGVLLRLEEAYKLFYERQYKGKDSFDKWSESLTQAEKRTIYYKEAMRLLSEKTEGVAVKTNEVQSVLMKLRDAWYKLGTDLEDAGTLNPLIWALEKIVSLAEGVANTFMTISDGYKALQYRFPAIFGTPDIEFKAKEVSDVYANRKKAVDSIKENYMTEEEAGKQLYEKLAKYQSKYYDSIQENRRKKDAVIINRDYSKARPEQYIERNAWLDSQIQDDTKKYEEISDVMFKFNERRKEGNVLTEDTIKLLSPYLKGLDESYQRAKKISELDNKSGETGYEKFILRPVMSFQNVLNTDDVTAKIQWAIVAKEKIVELDKQLATSQKLSTYALGEYNTKFEELKNNIKARFQDEMKMTPEQIKNLEKYRKLGALTSLAQYDFISGADSEKDYSQGFQVATTKARSKDDPKYKDVLEKSFKKMLENNELSIPDLVEFNKQNKKQLDELLKPYTDAQKANLRGDVDFRMRTTDSLKDKVIEALTIGEADKQKIKETREWVEKQYALWKDLSKSGSAVGLFNNFVNMLLQNQKTKTSGTGRSKAPKEFWDKWYEMNRTAFTEAMPEGITRDIEQARLDWYDQVKNLENLKKDIEQAKAAGRLDPEENLKFFGPKGNDPKVFENQMKAFRDTIENNYSRMLDKMSKELQERLNEINPFQQFIKDANLRQLEERGKYLSENPAQGGIASWNIGNKNSAVLKAEQYDKLKTIQIDINRIKYANELKTIEKEKSAIQEEARKNIQAQTQLEIANLEAFKQGDKEWKNTAEFKIKKEAILKKYNDMELLAMQDINNQYAERKKWTANILLDNSLTLGFLNKEREAVEKIAKSMENWYQKKQQYRAEDERVKSKFANENPDITAYGFNAMGFGETEESMAMKMGGAGEKVFNDLMKSRFSSLKMFMQTFKTDTAFNFQLGGANFELLGDEGKERLRAEADAMTNIFTDALDAIKKAVGDASGFWKQALAEMFSGVANFAGNMAWNAITGEDVSGVQALREARKTDLKDQQENLKNKSITQETYAKRAYEIEKTYIENKKAAEKNYRNEQWKQLGAVFWAQGMGYMIKGGIDMFINPTAGQAELAGGAALMALGAMLGYGRGGKKAMSKANMAEESKATKQDINVYVDNKIFEDKRQLRQAINNASV